MKALVCQSLESGTLSWQIVADPDFGKDELLIAVKESSINFADTLLVRGNYQIRLTPPFVPGMEVAGEVIAVGADVSGFAPGDRVAAVLPEFGGFAEQVAVSARSVFKLPKNLPLDVAACIPSVVATAHYGLVHRAALITGETVLVLGATGGVGMASIGLGKKLGAKVIAVVSSDEKGLVASQLGADHVINYSQLELKQTVKDITGGAGVDIIVDPVGGELTKQALRAIAWDGRHLVVGFAAGNIPAIATNILLLKSATMMGVNFGGFSAKFDGPAKQICDHVIALLAGDHSLWPLISRRVPMSTFGSDLSSSPQSSLGKIVLSL